MDTITANQANGGPGGQAGAGGIASVGNGGAPGGSTGFTAIPGTPGASGTSGRGIGGGLGSFPGANTTIDNTNINGNSASSADNDVTGTSPERL